MSGFLVICLCVMFSALASIFLKIGSNNLTGAFDIISLLGNQMIWLGAIFYAVSFISYIYALKLMPLSLTQPVITGGVSVVIALVSILFFRESMNFINWLGLLLVCVGISLLFMNRT